MNYIRKHWRGEFSLSISFWINLLVISIILYLIDFWLTNVLVVRHPLVSLRTSFILTIIKICVVCPWQLVGLWQSSKKHSIKFGRMFWTRAIKSIVIIVCIYILVIVCASFNIYKNLYEAAFRGDTSPDYILTLCNNNSLLHLEGGLKIGISKDVAAILKENPTIKGIILDTFGGRAFEAMELSKLILHYDIDTYSLKGCYSAGTIAFVSGRSRFLCTGAKLGFHQGHSKYEKLFNVEIAKEGQEATLIFFKQKGIKKEFVEKIYLAPPSEVWIPSTDELLAAGVIHGVINPSDLIKD